MLPSMLAEELQERLTSYLGTTFALAEDDARQSLTRFLTDPATSIFRGPYLRVRLPFRRADDTWREQLDWAPREFRPWRHQALAFERLSSKNRRPEPTIVTTGTGSGKTESFLIPILDHCARERAAGRRGIKALVLYPMNALANDQAGRIAELIDEHRDELGDVTAGLYTGDSGQNRHMSRDHIIEHRDALCADPPDILLTNYKMLDRLLLGKAARGLWDDAADALRYLVLDEFHTYDGAQGTDVALLLRRLGLVLGIGDTDRPLGSVAPVATSATLGDGGRTEELLEFAKTVFGRDFTIDSLIREDRLGGSEWINTLPEPADARAGRIPLLAEFADAVPEGRDIGYDDLIAATLDAFFEEDSGLEPADRHALGAALARHPLTQAVIDATTTPCTVDDVLRSLTTVAPTWANSLETEDAQRARIGLAAFIALLSHARTGTSSPLLHVETQLWVREVTHLVRTLTSVPTFQWYDDHPGAHEETVLSAVYCRHCGRGGWGAALAGPTGGQLDDRIPNAWKMSAVRSDRFRVYLHAPGEADADENSVAWLDPATLEVRGRRHPEETLLPVVTTPDGDTGAAQNGSCPSCGKDDAMRFLGSGVSTLVSVALSHLFGHAGVQQAEKKTLVFTDSVQDAAHRAGFVESRAYTFNLRSALHRAIPSEGGIRLDQIDSRLIDVVRGRDKRAERYALLPPELVDRKGFHSFWNDNRLRNTRHVEERMSFAAHLEFGLNSRTGRTLELTGTISVHIDTDSDSWLATRVNRVVDENRPATLDLPDGFTARPLAWARGVLERLRTQGAIRHQFLNAYVNEGGNIWRLTGGRNRASGMPGFRRRGPVPRFPVDGPGTDYLDSIVTPRTWFTWWTHRCLGVPEADAPKLVKALFETFAAEGVLEKVGSGTARQSRQSVVYQLPPDRILLERVDAERLAAGHAILRCDVCATRVPVHPDSARHLTDAPCTRKPCPGHLRVHPEAENYYRALYGKEKIRRIVAHEHTGLLKHDVRTTVERNFKNSEEPDAPNVLACTPTLELGIDIGDLGVVALTSLPRSPAGYLQRVGRAGRRSGNAFIVAVLPGRAAELHHFNSPLDMIAGEVTPPACYLDAEEILRRQYFAALVDRSAGRLGSKWGQPRDARALLENGLDNDERFLKRLLDDARKNAAVYVTEFLASLGEKVTERTAAELRAWAGVADGDDVPGIERAVQDAIDRWTRERDELSDRIGETEKALTELKRKEALLGEEGQKDLKRLAGEFRAAKEKRRKLVDGEDWLGSLEALGLLPNYTLLDDVTRLDIGLWWIDEETQEPDIEESQYERGSRTALAELAPGATFYASRRAVRVDAVDIGGTYNSTVQGWRCCPSCGWSGADTGPVSCPRCDDQGAADTGQRLDVIPFRRVSAFAALDEARFGDEQENRVRTRFDIATSADVDPVDIRDTWELAGYPFGSEYCRKIRIRWFNLGLLDRGGTDRRIAGATYSAPLFTVCTGCGVVPAAQGKERHNVRHRGWCPQRRAADPDGWKNVALMHELHTEALRLLVPPTVVADDSQLASFTAALKLGLRAVLGGSPDHLDAFACLEKTPTGRRQMVVLHDLVPGGTGYLTKFAAPEQVHDLLNKAKKHLEQCRCAEIGQVACHRCLLSVGRSEEVELLRRDRALGIINEILDHWEPRHGGAGVRTITAGGDETHIERRFREQLIRWAKRNKLLDKINAGAKGDRVRFSIGDSGTDRTRHWIAEPQVSIDDFVRPDFVLSPVGHVSARIAVFCDSVRFHASAEHNKAADDARKRAELRERGYLVWSVTHEDMEAFERVLEGDEPGALPFATNAQHEQFVRGANATSGLGSVAAAKIRGDAMSLLTDYLRHPERAHWRAVAQAFSAGMLVAGGRGQVRGVDGADLPGIVQRHGRGAEINSSGARQIGLTHTAHGTPVVLLRGDRHIDAVAVLDDAPAQVGGAGFLAQWRDWLAIGNLLQMLDDVLLRYAAVTTTGQVTEDDLPGYVPPVRFSPDWRELDEVCKPQLQPLLVPLASHPVPLPELGYEPNDIDVPIDLAWPDAGLAVEYKPTRERVDRLRELGWHVLPAEPDQVPEPRAIIEYLDSTGEAH
ncbi:DEAD/DEAH box helicase [Saccharopolyspora sp. NPDC002578]